MNLATGGNPNPTLSRTRMPPLLTRLLQRLLAATMLATGIPGARAQTEWEQSLEFRSLAYFLFSNRIERFNLRSEVFASRQNLPRSGATAFTITFDGIWIAYGERVYRYTTSLGDEQFVATVNSPVHGLAVDGDILIAVHSADLRFRASSFRISTNELLDYEETDRGEIYGLSYSPKLRRLFGRDAETSSKVLTAADISAEGDISEAFESSFPASDFERSTWLWPDETLISAGRGQIHDTFTLEKVGEFPTRISAMDFHADRFPVIVRNRRLSAFNDSLQETGGLDLDNNARALFTVNDAVFAFSPAQNATGVLPQKVLLSQLNVPDPALSLDPGTLAFEPDGYFIDRDGVLLIYSRLHRSVFRWSIAQREYLETITLPRTSTHATYCATNHSLYFVERSGEISVMAATPGSAFTTIGQTGFRTSGIVALDNYILINHYSGGNFASHSIFGLDGALVSTDGGRKLTLQFDWNPATRRVYSQPFSSAEPLQVDTVDVNGVIDTRIEKRLDGYLAHGPVRVNEAGTLSALGVGLIFNANLAIIKELNRNLTEMAWRGNNLLSIEPGDPGVTLMRGWNTDFTIQKTVTLAGDPRRIFNLPGDITLVTTLDGGAPRFHLLDATHTPISGSITDPPSLSIPPKPTRTDYGGSVTFQVQALGGAPLSYQWEKEGQPIPGATGREYTIENCGSDDAARYRVIVSNAAGTVTSAAVRLGVGPVRTSPFTPGNLLISTNNQIREYTTAGALRRVIDLPPPPEFTTHSLLDLTIDRFGRLILLDERQPEQSATMVITIWDPEFDLWTDHPFPARSSINGDGRGTIGVLGDWIITGLGRLHLINPREIENPNSDPDCCRGPCVGRDGLFYSPAGGNSVVRSYRPDDWSVVNPNVLIGIEDNPTVSGTAATERGDVFFATSDVLARPPRKQLGKKDGRNGQFTFITMPSFDDFLFTDVQISKDNLVLYGGGLDNVVLTDVRFTDYTTIQFPRANTISFGSWIEPDSVPAPTVTTAPPAAAPEDAPFAYDPGFSHVNPDAILTITPTVVPGWITIGADGAMAGTPLEEHIGIHPVEIVVIDQFGERTELNFALEVTEVNDAPTAVPATETRPEDSPRFLVPLAPLFDDEESEDSELTFEVASNNRPDLVTPAISARNLEVTPIPNAYGTATIMVRATDPGGLGVEAEVTVILTPVDDPPVASDLVVSGSLFAGATLEANFTFSDLEQDAPGAHLYQWFRAGQPDGSSRTDLPGATQSSYTATADDVGKYLGVDVTPVAATGDSPTGLLLTSPTAGPIDKASTTLLITADAPDPSFVNDPVALQFSLSFDALLISGTPTGTITITAPGAAPVIIPVPAAGGSIVLPQAGTQELTVSYSGDDSFHGSSGVESHLVHSQVWISPADPQSALEDDATTFTATITRSGDHDTDLPVNLAVTGSATPESDYLLTGATISAATIPAGEDSITLSLRTLVENLEEPDETIIVTLQSGARYSLAGGQNVATFSILNDDVAPVANSDPLFRVVEDSLLVVDSTQGVLANDTDQDDGDGPEHLTAHLRNDAANGTLILRPDGSFDYAPDPDYFGPDSFIYAASDGTNFSEPIQVDIEITELVDLRLASAASRGVVGAPGSVTHTVTLENLGPSDGTDIAIDLLYFFPAGVTRNTPIVSRGTISGAQWLLDLAENQRATLEVRYEISVDARGGIDVIATTASLNSLSQPLTRDGDDVTSVRSSIIGPSDLGILEVDATPGLNRQNGLFTQQLTITNHNPLPLAGFRLLIGSLPGDVQVYNAHGVTAGGVAYIESNNDLAVGGSVILTIEFFRASLQSDFAPTYSIDAVFAEDPDEPPIAREGADLERLVVLANGDLLLEFSSTPGATYAIEFSHDLVNWHRVVPTITANATRTQWIDAGPPKTPSHPAETPTRCYRIVELPLSPGR